MLLTENAYSKYSIIGHYEQISYGRYTKRIFKTCYSHICLESKSGGVSNSFHDHRCINMFHLMFDAQNSLHMLKSGAHTRRDK